MYKTSTIDQRFSDDPDLIRESLQHKQKGGNAMKHYILTAGLRGYMPNFLSVHHNINDASETARDVLKIGENKCRELRRYGVALLNRRYHGNEYAEITACDCDSTRDHFESDVEYQWVSILK